MHELGIVVHIVKMVEEVGEQNSLTSVSRVKLTLGEVSGVVPDYLVDCWRWTAEKNDLIRDSVLEVEEAPAVTVCNDCGRTYSTVEHGRTCPYCASENTVLVTGDQIELTEIEAC
ncbi:hydrogenase maturation nickel metallochaperone HypA [Paratractidigestivibacter sp.]|uniref:hydrogenase maturation nickel metallochaperone HypA n=1 Tax=Paratractidigestivibacter sp. TaxID=2847316 RepID=UPI002ABDDE7E|nr:hydrogenase maturation nickel metallochaperone HypA [Paratractidigestivibacter sp.]